MSQTNETYPVFIRDLLPSHRIMRVMWRARKTGEFRAPKKDEWYLSGATVEAYRARNNLTQEYYIAELVPYQR